MNYYVYAYLRKNGLPYYIGKGKDKRAWSKNHGRVSVPNDLSKIVILHENLSEKEAHLLEVELIKLYGRKDKDNGILINLTDGGEGGSGRILNADSIEKLREKTSLLHLSGKYGFALGHASSAGKIGGKSKSQKKLDALKNNHKKNEEMIKGSKWMFNPVSSTFHRIKKELVDEHLNLGWQLKFKSPWNKGIKTKS